MHVRVLKFTLLLRQLCWIKSDIVSIRELYRVCRNFYRKNIQNNMLNMSSDYVERTVSKARFFYLLTHFNRDIS